MAPLMRQCEPEAYQTMIKFCTGCGSTDNAFAYLDNGKVDQPRYRCLKCKSFFAFVGHGRKHGTKYTKKRNVDPLELRDLPRHCPDPTCLCVERDRVPFRYYNNKSTSQPVFQCLQCKRRFTMRLETHGTSQRLVHSGRGSRSSRSTAHRSPKHNAVGMLPHSPTCSNNAGDRSCTMSTDAAESASWFTDLDEVMPSIRNMEEFPEIPEDVVAPESACFTDLDDVLDRVPMCESMEEFPAIPEDEASSCFTEFDMLLDLAPMCENMEEFPVVPEDATALESASLDEVLDGAPMCENMEEFPMIPEESASSEPLCIRIVEILANDEAGVSSSRGQFGDINVEDVPLPLPGMEGAGAQGHFSFSDWAELQMAVDEQQQHTWPSSQSRSCWEWDNLQNIQFVV